MKKFQKFAVVGGLLACIAVGGLIVWNNITVSKAKAFEARLPSLTVTHK